MQDPDLIQLFVAPLELAGIEYMITGSVATAVYGEPRNTLDIDLAIFPARDQIETFHGLYPAEDFYLPPVEVIQVECLRETRGHFNIIHHHSGLKADAYPSRNHPYLQWSLENRRRIRIHSLEVSFAPPEYVILYKLEFFREGGSRKHLRDIAGVIAQQSLDLPFLETATQNLGLIKDWRAALQLADS
ncbi:MAG: hypothetical protein H7Y36_10695 [Armatimonadetes bacterium]|nr:hypothetical protein [Akkermansiaceae bacterium]